VAVVVVGVTRGDANVDGRVGMTRGDANVDGRR